MNCLNVDKKIQILNCLVEGNSIRSIERMTGVHRDADAAFYETDQRI